MKKGLSKLILSGAAVAAVAATLGTSTYAWYTTNPTVSANNIVGASTDTGSSSIFISNTYTTASIDEMDWSASVDFDGVADVSNKLAMSTAKVYPSYYQGAGKFQKLNPETGKLAAAANGVGSNDVVHFQLYFKQSVSDAAMDIYIKSLKIVNTTTGALPLVDNLLYKRGEDDTVTGGIPLNQSKYQVDFVKALAFAYNNSGDSASGSFTLNDSVTKGEYSVTTTKAITDANADAQGYYNAVMTKAGLATLDSTAKSAAPKFYDKAKIATLDKTAATYDTVDFFVYLDGASEFCYDACIKQNFKLNIEFTTEASKAMQMSAYTA